MTEEQATAEELQERLRRVEDQLALYQVIATYGPAVDSGSSEVAASLWSEDGVYDTFPRPLHGRDEIAGMVRSDGHQRLIRSGCAHVLGLPHVEVTGDTAVATCYSQLFLHDEQTDAFRVWRVSANRWEFWRTADGWRVTSRVNRPLDGDEHARRLFQATLLPGSTR